MFVNYDRYVRPPSKWWALFILAACEGVPVADFITRDHMDAIQLSAEIFIMLAGLFFAAVAWKYGRENVAASKKQPKHDRQS